MWKVLALRCAVIAAATLFVPVASYGAGFGYVGISRTSSNYKIDSEKGATLTEFSTADFGINMSFISRSQGSNWGFFANIDVGSMGLFTTGSSNLKTTNKTTGVVTESSQPSGSEYRASPGLLWFIPNLQLGMMYFFSDYVAIGPGLQVSTLLLGNKSSLLTEPNIRALEIGLTLQMLITIPWFEPLLTVHFVPSISGGPSDATEDSISSSLFGKSQDFGKGSLTKYDLKFVAEIFTHLGVYVQFGSEKRAYKDKLPVGGGPTTVSDTYLRIGAAFVFSGNQSSGKKN